MVSGAGPASGLQAFVDAQQAAQRNAASFEPLARRAPLLLPGTSSGLPSGGPALSQSTLSSVAEASAMSHWHRDHRPTRRAGGSGAAVGAGVVGGGPEGPMPCRLEPKERVARHRGPRSPPELRHLTTATAATPAASGPAALARGTSAPAPGRGLVHRAAGGHAFLAEEARLGTHVVHQVALQRAPPSRQHVAFETSGLARAPAAGLTMSFVSEFDSMQDSMATRGSENVGMRGSKDHAAVCDQSLGEPQQQACIGRHGRGSGLDGASALQGLALPPQDCCGASASLVKAAGCLASRPTRGRGVVTFGSPLSGDLPASSAAPQAALGSQVVEDWGDRHGCAQFEGRRVGARDSPRSRAGPGLSEFDGRRTCTTSQACVPSGVSSDLKAIAVDAEAEELNEMLQSCLARGLGHLQSLQELVACRRK
mmetsp:Transcript_91564/g.262257  ORF Transcript_91564/g.262257 Transcript_91564/m.262257 type:complete len:425 (+) Transcript_91564:948-2222(+)